MVRGPRLDRTEFALRDALVARASLGLQAGRTDLTDAHAGEVTNGITLVRAFDN